MSEKKEPLMEKIDYPDFVRDFVTQKLAQHDLEASAELSLYIAQDVESYLLDSHKTISDLTGAEKLHIDEFIKGRVDGAKNIIPINGASGK